MKIWSSVSEFEEESEDDDEGVEKRGGLLPPKAKASRGWVSLLT